MIIAPLVFAMLVVGIAHMATTGAIGRIGAKPMAWFIGASLVSLMLGMVMVNILRPGENLGLRCHERCAFRDRSSGCLAPPSKSES